MKSLITLSLICFCFAGQVQAAGFQENKLSSLSVFNQFKEIEAKSNGGNWNPEESKLVETGISADYLNLVSETTVCGTEFSKEKLDRFFARTALTSDIVLLLNKPIKSCLETYLGSN
jgi:hypothetical protein